MTWFGWIWNTRRQRWERVCGPFETLSACSTELRRIARPRAVRDVYTVMTTADMRASARPGRGRRRF